MTARCSIHLCQYVSLESLGWEAEDAFAGLLEGGGKKIGHIFTNIWLVSCQGRFESNISGWDNALLYLSVRRVVSSLLVWA